MKLSITVLVVMVTLVSAEELSKLRNNQPRDLLAQVVDRISMIQSELELLARQFQRTLIGNARVSRLVSEKVPSVEDIEAITKQLIQTDIMVASMTKQLASMSLEGRQFPGMPGGLPGMDQIMAMFTQLTAQFQQLSGLLGGITSGLVRTGGSTNTTPGGMANPFSSLTQILAQLTGNLGTMGEAFRLG